MPLSSHERRSCRDLRANQKTDIVMYGLRSDMPVAHRVEFVVTNIGNSRARYAKPEKVPLRMVEWLQKTTARY